MSGRGVPSSIEPTGIDEELTRDDPIRLADFLKACERASLLDTYPASNDDSQLAQFLRDAWTAGLLANTRASKAVGGTQWISSVPNRFGEGIAVEPLAFGTRTARESAFTQPHGPKARPHQIHTPVGDE